MKELLLEEKPPQALQALCERLNKNVQEKSRKKRILLKSRLLKIVLNIGNLPFTMIMMMTISVLFKFRLIEKLLNDDSSPHTSKELNFEIHDAIIESFSPSPIPIEDNDSLMEEIDIFLAPDDSIPS
nr:hypothetical protein [Tanacetum cinerariifolium]GEX07976.1 hypothetical protein [Tanacetum cinerariifolium]